MKSMKISEYSYNFLKQRAKSESRSITATLDLLVKLFQGVENEGMEKASISASNRKKKEK